MAALVFRIQAEGDCSGRLAGSVDALELNGPYVRAEIELEGYRAYAYLAAEPELWRALVDAAAPKRSPPTLATRALKNAACVTWPRAAARRERSAYGRPACRRRRGRHNAGRRSVEHPLHPEPLQATTNSVRPSPPSMQAKQPRSAGRSRAPRRPRARARSLCGVGVPDRASASTQIPSGAVARSAQTRRFARLPSGSISNAVRQRLDSATISVAPSSAIAILFGKSSPPATLRLPSGVTSATIDGPSKPPPPLTYALPRPSTTISLNGPSPSSDRSAYRERAVEHPPLGRTSAGPSGASRSNGASSTRCTTSASPRA